MKKKVVPMPVRVFFDKDTVGLYKTSDPMYPFGVYVKKEVK